MVSCEMETDLMMLLRLLKVLDRLFRRFGGLCLWREEEEEEEEEDGDPGDLCRSWCNTWYAECHVSARHTLEWKKKKRRRGKVMLESTIHGSSPKRLMAVSCSWWLLARVEKKIQAAMLPMTRKVRLVRPGLLTN